MLDPSDRSGLIEIAARGAPTPACKRAFTTGRVEVLGGFDTIPPGCLAGWLLSVTTKRGSLWIVAVIADVHRHEYRVRLQADVPWQLWIGDQIEDPEHYSIYVGDHPEQYLERRLKALEEYRDSAYQAVPRRVRRTRDGDRPGMSAVLG